MTERKTPIEQALDLFFYAPLGLVMNAEEIVPQLAERGRQQVMMARMMGQYTVKQGQAEAEKALVRLQNLAEQPGPRRTARRQPSADGEPATAARRRSAPVARPATQRRGGGHAGHPRLRQPVGLAGRPSAREPVRATSSTRCGRTSRRNRGRKTILNKIDQLRPRARNGWHVVEAVRPATHDDVARVAELAAPGDRRAVGDEGRHGLGAARGTERTARRVGAVPRSMTRTAVALVGTIDDVVVGYAVAAVEVVADGGRLARLTDLYVEPGAREVGVGELLLDTVLAWATEARLLRHRLDRAAGQP